MRLLICFLMLLLPLAVLADGVPTGPYVPLQPAHFGNWYSPDSPGEGLDLSVIETDDTKVIFANIYLIRDGQQIWHSAQADWFEARDPLARDYELPAFARIEPGGEPVSTGAIWLRPDGSHLRAQFAVGGQLWQRTLYQLTRAPGAGHIGYCGWNGFYPRPPAAPDGWCHDQ